MSSTIDYAQPSTVLYLEDANPVLFLMRDKPNTPCTVTLPGSSSLALTLFDVTAIGTVAPIVPGDLILTLYGMSKTDIASGAADPHNWLPLGSCVAEPIGGAGELEETMWMIRGKDLMVFPGSGRMQGTFDSNVANNPQAPVDLEHRPGDITDEDPLYVFAVGASYTPTGTRSKAGEALCSVTLKSLTLSD